MTGGRPPKNEEQLWVVAHLAEVVQERKDARRLIDAMEGEREALRAELAALRASLGAVEAAKG